MEHARAEGMSRLFTIVALAIVLLVSARPARACASAVSLDAGEALFVAGVLGLASAVPAVELDLPSSERGPQAVLTWPMQIPITFDDGMPLRLVLEPQWVLNHGDDPAFRFRGGVRYAFFTKDSEAKLNPFVGLGGNFSKATAAVSGEVGVRFPKYFSYVVARLDANGDGARTGIATGMSFY